MAWCNDGNTWSSLTGYACALMVLLATCTRAYGGSAADDLDGDGVVDKYEQYLLDLYAPVLYTHEVYVPFQERVGIPVGADWLVRHSKVWFDDVVIAEYPSLYQAIAMCQVLDSSRMRLENVQLWGGDGAEPRTWDHATWTAEGSYGRVWRPWPDEYPFLHSVQYMLYLTWNETSFSGDEGNHEGDWTMLDLTVDTEANMMRPPVIHAIVHNHGRQLFVDPEALLSEGGRPQVFSEKGTNEWWGNPGLMGKSGWPRVNGWATNADFDTACDELDWFEWFGCVLGDVSEEKVSREHSGAGYRMDFSVSGRAVPNIGDNGVSLCGPEGTFIQLYAGKWGRLTGGTFSEGDPPTSPVYNKKMGQREWLDGENPPQPVGPWSALGSPWQSDLPKFIAYTLPGYEYYVPQKRATVFVDASADWQGDGTVNRPFRGVDLGAAMTTDGGTVMIRPGTYDGPVVMRKRVILTAPNGGVTIGD